MEEELEIIRAAKHNTQLVNDQLSKSHSDWSEKLKILERQMLDLLMGPGPDSQTSSIVLQGAKIKVIKAS